LQAAVNASVSKFVFTGTSWEKHSLQDPTPVNFYAATKAAFSNIAAFFGVSHQLAVVRLEVFDTFGPHDTRGKIVQTLIDSMPSMRFALSPGLQKHFFTYIDDIINALQTALDLPLPAGLHQYSLHGDEILTLQDVVGTITRVTGKELAIDWGSKPYRPREVMTPYIRYQRLQGWNPIYSFASGLEKMSVQNNHR
jgi:nucleoside-diphosphate-sugar epimerase